MGGYKERVNRTEEFFNYIPFQVISLAKLSHLNSLEEICDKNSNTFK
jgi:hypothetical protein